MKYNRRYNPITDGASVIKRFDNARFARLLREKYGEKPIDKFWLDYYKLAQFQEADTPSRSTVNNWYYGRTSPNSDNFYAIVTILENQHWADFFTEKRVS